MRIVVTGGAGFVGANLVGKLVREEFVDEVVVVDDLSTGYRSNIDQWPEATFLEGSILDESLMAEVIRGSDAVVHLAALPSVPRSIEDPGASHEVNATGTLRVLEAARQADGVYTILASSSSVYGANPTLPKSEKLLPVPMSPYAVSKQATEAYGRAYSYCFDLPVLPFRFFNIYGQLQSPNHAYAAVVPAFIHAALQGRAVPRHGDGEQSRDFTYVGTVADVIVDAIRRQVVSSEPVNLAFGTRCTLNELLETLGDQLGRRLSIETLPPRPGDVRHSQADSSRLVNLFPEIEPVSLQGGLAHTIEWFRSSPQQR